MTARSMILAAAAALGLAATAAANGPFGAGRTTAGHGHQPRFSSLSALVGANKQPLPAFQAAPWYLYWPYDAHFLTPAPVTGAFYGAPGGGNMPVNPYFPAPSYGGYGPIPGGPAPGLPR